MKPFKRLAYWTACFIYLVCGTQAARFLLPAAPASTDHAMICGAHECGCDIEDERLESCCCGPVTFAQEDTKTGAEPAMLVMCADPTKPAKAPSSLDPHMRTLVKKTASAYGADVFQPPTTRPILAVAYDVPDKVPIGFSWS